MKSGDPQCREVREGDALCLGEFSDICFLFKNPTYIFCGKQGLSENLLTKNRAALYKNIPRFK